MKRKIQTNFFEKLGMHSKRDCAHGGEHAKGKRKTRRPLDRNKPLHLVLRSEHARGQYSFLQLKNRQKIKQIIAKQAKKYGVRIESFANVGNHLHLMLRFGHRLFFQNFLRTITCLIARFVTKARRSSPFKEARFWSELAFTRVVTTQKECAILRKYIAANIIEAKHGYIAREVFRTSRAEWEDRLYES